MESKQFEKLAYTNFAELTPGGFGQGMTFLFRHAARYPLITPEDVFNAGLTDQGVEDARALGQNIHQAWKIHRVFSSPIQRCIHTGQSVLEGAEVVIPIQTKWWLFSPNLRAEQSFTPYHGVLTLTSQRYTMIVDKGKLKMALDRIKVPKNPGEVNLYVAHDTTVLPMLAFLLGMDEVSAEAVPGFLEGIALSRQDGKITLVDS